MSQTSFILQNKSGSRSRSAEDHFEDWNQQLSSSTNRIQLQTLLKTKHRSCILMCLHERPPPNKQTNQHEQKWILSWFRWAEVRWSWRSVHRVCVAVQQWTPPLSGFEQHPWTRGNRKNTEEEKRGALLWRYSDTAAFLPFPLKTFESWICFHPASLVIFQVIYRWHTQTRFRWVMTPPPFPCFKVKSMLMSSIQMNVRWMSAAFDAAAEFQPKATKEGSTFLNHLHA